MKQKVVMQVPMHCQKCRVKAMEIAAASNGVTSVAVEGREKDRLVVIGDGMDATNIATRLRKKLGHTQLLTLEAVQAK